MCTPKDTCSSTVNATCCGNNIHCLCGPVDTFKARLDRFCKIKVIYDWKTDIHMVGGIAARYREELYSSVLQSLSFPAINKLCHLPATTDIKLLPAVTAVCIALGSQTVHST